MLKGISGITIIKNAKKLGYPLYYSVKSIINACDEFVISEGYSEDDTMDIIKKLQHEYPDKIRVFQDEWTKSKKGETIAKITNHAIRQCKHEWIYCIQADEIIHEDNLDFLRNIPYRYKKYHAVSFQFTHFRPTLQYEMLGAYTRAIRMFRNYSTPSRLNFRMRWQNTSVGKYLKSKLPVDPLMFFEDIYSDTDGFTFAGNVFPVLRPTFLHPIAHVGYVSNDKQVIYQKLLSHAENLYPDLQMYKQMSQSASTLTNPQASGVMWEEQGYKISKYQNTNYPKLLVQWAKEEGIEYNRE
ncbi:MAG: glycosyltransferase [Thermoproteota archaeon]